MDSITFLHAIEATNPKMIDRVVALIWFHLCGAPGSIVNLRTLCEEIETAGFAEQNQTRLRAALKKDQRLLSKKDDCFAINARHKSKIEEQYSEYTRNRILKTCDAVLPTELFSQAKGYIQKVVLQLNASYDYNLFDCTAVMCRRLLEILIIEAYEHSDKSDSIKGPDGHFLMFAGLMDKINKSCPFQLGRSSMKGLADFKSLGDLSAHNRRFNARKSDLDKVQDGLRVACEELLHVAGQGPNA